MGQVLERRGLIGRDIESAWPATDLVAGKSVGINHTIGRRLTLASGISDGDFAMFEYTTSVQGLQLGLLPHHDSGEPEYACDRRSSVGRVERGLDEAAQRGWVIVRMKDDRGAPTMPTGSEARPGLTCVGPLVTEFLDDLQVLVHGDSPVLKQRLSCATRRASTPRVRPSRTAWCRVAVSR